MSVRFHRGLHVAGNAMRIDELGFVTCTEVVSTAAAPAVSAAISEWVGPESLAARGAGRHPSSAGSEPVDSGEHAASAGPAGTTAGQEPTPSAAGPVYGGLDDLIPMGVRADSDC